MPNDFKWNKKLVDDLFNGLGDKMELVGQYVEGQAIKNITDMNAVDSGRLKNSITHVTDKKELTTTIGTNVEYAPFVELGAVKMAPRPFLRLALIESENKIKEILKR